MVDASSYVLNNAVSGISMTSTGTTTVIMTRAIAPTPLTVSVTTNGGAETKTSSVFSLEIEDS